jgi:hypothetical protein
VPSVAAVHHPLRHVDAGASHIRPPVHIDYAADRAAVYAHSQAKFRMFLERPTHLERAFDRFFLTVTEDQRYAVAGRDFD